MNKNNIALLLVEDEPHIAQGLVFNLEEEGYQVTHVESGEQALEQLAKNPYALLILDLTLPDIDGLEVCSLLREQENQIPILMLTARGSEQDRITGLSKGADDYLAKPFNLKEFLLRVAGLLRRAHWQSAQTENKHYQFGVNWIDLETHQATTATGTIQLTELEMKILLLFLLRKEKSYPGRNSLNRSGAWHQKQKPAHLIILSSVYANILRLIQPSQNISAPFEAGGIVLSRIPNE